MVVQNGKKRREKIWTRSKNLVYFRNGWDQSRCERGEDSKWTALTKLLDKRTKKEDNKKKKIEDRDSL